MPRYHVVAAAVARPNGGTELLSSIRPGRMSRYTSTSPMGAFRWPMDTMTREEGELAMNYDDVMAYVHNTGRTYWIGRFYKNYSGLLDGYITFAHSARYYHFIMDYEPQHVQIGEDYDGYPTPAHFYLARSAIMTGTSWTIADYNAVPDPHGRPIPAAPIAAAIPAAIPAAPIPEEGETDEPTIEEGGTDFVYKGLLLFLCLVIFPQARIPIFPFTFSYCFDYFRFCFMYLLSYLVFAFIGFLFVVVRFSTNTFCTLSNSFHQCV
jgi:hypothetical protein